MASAWLASTAHVAQVYGTRVCPMGGEWFDVLPGCQVPGYDSSSAERRTAGWRGVAWRRALCQEELIVCGC